MSTRIHDVTVYEPGDTLPDSPEGYSVDKQIIDWLANGAHVAILDDGTWLATYRPDSEPSAFSSTN